MQNREKYEMLKTISELTRQAQGHILNGNMSDYQKNIVLASRGLKMLYDDLCQEVKASIS